MTECYLKYKGGVHNPYGIPISKLWWIANPYGIISYLSGIFSSKAWKKATDFIQWWVKIGIEERLQTTLNTNGNAFEWFILEMLIHTKVHERSFFERPPQELDREFATDLIYSSPHWLVAWWKTLWIQITTTQLNHKFTKKKKKVREINTSLVSNKGKLLQFGYKRPDTMSIVGIYGHIWHMVIKEGHTIFSRDLWLPLNEPPIHFKWSIIDEAKDIADFLRMSILTWNDHYSAREGHKREQGKSMKWRAGIYQFRWFYSPSQKSTIFSFYKKGVLVSRFEILDAPG